jgi:hypothetical protein
MTIRRSGGGEFAKGQVSYKQTYFKNAVSGTESC